MKKLLILCIAGLLASSSGYAYTLYVNHYFDGNNSRVSESYYSPNNSLIYIQLHAVRTIAPTGEEACYSSICCEIFGGDYIYESTYSQYKGVNSYLNKWVYVGTTGYLLRVFLYCPEVGDYTSARVYW